MKANTTHVNVESYLSGIFTPPQAKALTLTQCWFLNGRDNTKNVRFIHEQIAEKFQIWVSRDCTIQEDTHDLNLFGNWDYLLISLFDIRFVVVRLDELGQFVVKTPEYSCISEYPIYRNICSNPATVKDAVRVGDNTSIEVNNQFIKVYTPQNMIEYVSCRTTLLYILSQAYIQRMIKSLDALITFNTKKGRFTDSYYGECTDLNQLFQKCIEFKIRYILVKPLDVKRVNDTTKIWNEIYNNLDIKAYIEDTDAKMKDIKTLQDNKGMEQMTLASNKLANLSNWIAGMAAFGTGVLSIILYILSR